MRTAFLSLTILCLVLAVTPAVAQNTLYSNGPYNGTTDAWAINFGFSVSNSFYIEPYYYYAQIGDFHFVYWDASTTDLVTTVDMQLGSTSFGGSPQTLTGVTNTFLGLNLYGYALYQANYVFAYIPWTGAGWVTLQNACTTSGCSVSNPIYWDENSGPSFAFENTLGSIPSEAFTLGGTFCEGCCSGPYGVSCIPEPSTILLFASGILGLASALRTKFTR